MGFLYGNYAAEHGDPHEVLGLLGAAASHIQEGVLGSARFLTGPDADLGLTGYVRRQADGVFIGCGDRLRASAVPETTSAEELQRWCSRQFSRFAAVYCRPGRLDLWTDEAAAFPLFYAFQADGSPVFATEAKALLGGIKGGSPLLGFAEGRPLPGEGETVFSGIRAVPPGTRLVLARKDGRWAPQQRHVFYSLPIEPDRIEPSRAVADVARTLEQVVQQQTEGLSRVGITLSGGLDSSSIAALARRYVPRIHTYTVGTPFGNEFEQAREVADFLGTHHRELMMEPEDVAALLPDLIWTMETWDPLTLQIAAPVAFLYNKLADEPKLLLTGYGADLIFAGAVDPGLQDREQELEHTVLQQVRLTVPTNELSPAFYRRLGLTVRYPFWAPAVLSLGLSLRGRLKLREGEVKWVLRRAMESVLPHRVAWRVKRGIHEGSAMARVFAVILATEDPVEQCRKLRQMAAARFVDGGRRSLEADLLTKEA